MFTKRVQTFSCKMHKPCIFNSKVTMVNNTGEERESTDRTRSNDHNAFISSVDAVNKICDAHGVPRIYTGSTERRAYGDFAMELVADIFAKRH